eukprot:TRINITY_DN32688_c0_g1_i1.p1 TRINITY_DN32688_c0_g1~~TRINITY_DN32688_c0_g1_i1.p1  ORF type:complete len:674 (+),score=285.83 TRINITY_DN32688_c0_g1_i1:57-2024(+)
MPPKKKKFAACSQPWEWRDDDGDWYAYNDTDAALLEKRWEKDEDAVFTTTAFSWNAEHSTVYKVAFDVMTQTNVETGVARSIRRGTDGSSPAKKAKVAQKNGKAAQWRWENDDDDQWEAFADADSAMLEAEYLKRGPKAVFSTKAFSFNKKHKTPYSIDFEEMTQTNTKSKTVRNIVRVDPHSEAIAAKGSPKKGSPKKQNQKAVAWEWFEAEAMEWHKYNAQDAKLLEAAYNSGGNVFITADLTFNKGYDTEYLFDFTSMSQINNESGTSRKMKRGDAEADAADDGGYASVVLSVAKTDKKKKLPTDLAALAPKFEPSLTDAVSKKQRGLGPQSLRGKMKRDYGHSVSKDAHATACFDEMLKNEKEFAGDWSVFYHSYSAAALLYEVQAAVACVLFRFKSEFATLPRLMYEPFEHIPTSARMLEEWPKWADRDHNQAFRKVGLCGVVSLLADDSEAPPKSCFLAGYSVGPLTGLLDALLEKCSVPKAKVKALAKNIVDLAVKHGLDSGAYGGKPCKSGRSGHYLQIFMRREIVDKYCYAAFPFGKPDGKRQPMEAYLRKDAKLQGQVRITANPEVFLQAGAVRMFLYSADKTFHVNRKGFQEELVDVLEPILGGTAQRVKAATGIFGGPPPPWWSSEDQAEEAKMTLSRYAAAH